MDNSVSPSHPPGFSPDSEDGEFNPARSVGNESGVVKDKENEKIPEFKPGGVVDGRPPAFPVFSRTKSDHIGVVSLFVDNLPENVNTRWLYTTFGKFGRMVDAYIPRHRRRRSKSQFGFVRFQSIDSVGAVLSNLNGYRVGFNQLLVQEAKYDRAGAIRRESLVESRGNSRALDVQVNGPSVRFSQRGCKTFAEGNRTFAQVVSGEVPVGGSAPPVAKRLKVDGVPFALDWLSNSIVAKIRLSSKQPLLADIGNSLSGLSRILKWGGRKIILVFLSRDLCEEAMSSMGTMEALEDFHVWNGEIVNDERITWISCHRLPLSVWNRSSFQAIAGMWGSLIATDEATTNGLDFSCARLLIETDLLLVGGEIEVSINDRIFKVSVKEDLKNLMDGAWPDLEIPSIEVGGCFETGRRAPGPTSGSSKNGANTKSCRAVTYAGGKVAYFSPLLEHDLSLFGTEMAGNSGVMSDGKVSCTKTECPSLHTATVGSFDTSFCEEVADSQIILNMCQIVVEGITNNGLTPLAPNDIGQVAQIGLGPDDLDSVTGNSPNSNSAPSQSNHVAALGFHEGGSHKISSISTEKDDSEDIFGLVDLIKKTGAKKDVLIGEGPPIVDMASFKHSPKAVKTGVSQNPVNKNSKDKSSLSKGGSINAGFFQRSLNLNNKSSRTEKKSENVKLCKDSEFRIPSITEEIACTRDMSKVLGSG